MRWFRWIHLGVVLAMVGAVAVLSLSDSPIRPVEDVVSNAGHLMRRAAVATGRRGGPGATLPFGPDKVLHFFGWWAVGFVAAGLATRFADRVNLVLGLVTLSAFFEVGQRYLTESRSAEFSDLVANGAGLATGFVLFLTAERLIGRLLPGRTGSYGTRTGRVLRFS